MQATSHHQTCATCPAEDAIGSVVHTAIAVTRAALSEYATSDAHVTRRT
jgi:hypothetical protein